MRHSLEMPSPQLPRYLRRNHGSLYVADSDQRDDDDDDDDSDHHDSDNDHRGSDSNDHSNDDDSCNKDDDTYDVQMIVITLKPYS